MSTVQQEWLSNIGWKLQSIMASGLRGPDHMLYPKIKQVSKWIRAVTQNNADPSKPYMNNITLPKPEELDKELEHCYVHFVHHFADALAIIAYYHPDPATARYAAQLHYHIAEELFHFIPEDPEVFMLRHRDKVNGQDERAEEWELQWKGQYETYMAAALKRFQK